MVMQCHEQAERNRVIHSGFYIRRSVHRNSRLKKSNKMEQYSDTSANEDNSFRNHIR